MPNRSKRVAVRQAQLRQRKHRGRGPTALEQMQRRGTLTGEVETATDPGARSEAAAGGGETTPAAASAPVAALRVASRRRESFEPAWQTPAYLRRELVQIGAVSGLILAILIVLAFVLR